MSRVYYGDDADLPEGGIGKPAGAVPFSEFAHAIHLIVNMTPVIANALGLASDRGNLQSANSLPAV